MYFRQFVHESLGHASYLVGSDETGEALVLDVRRDVDGYFDAARAEGLRIRWAADTHQHNDYASGICELPERADVQLLAGPRAELGYPVHAMADGERLELGEVVVELVETPGHTPEHVSFLLTDRSRGDEPSVLLSGGALLVGDVARPDLLGGEDETARGARDLCHTLRDRILPLPDHVEVYPTHVAGSLCGGQIGSRYATTIGQERRLNAILRHLEDEEAFVGHCLDLGDLPAVPPYWRRMRRLNTEGPPTLGVLPEPEPLDPARLDAHLDDGGVVLDVRSPEAFGSAHVPQALHAGLGSAFPTWAGTVLPPDRPYALVLEDPAQLWQATWELLRIGYEPPVGWLRGGMRGWCTSGRPFSLVQQITPTELAGGVRADGRELFVLDVRQPGEWAEGHVPGAVHITGAELPRRQEEVPRNRVVATVCGSGYRSSVAASVLRHHGHEHVVNVLGGMSAWGALGLPLSTD